MNLTRRELIRRSATTTIAALACRDLFAAAPGDYWPRGSSWESIEPRDAGMDPAAVEDAVRFAGDHKSTGLVILRRGRIVSERYWQGWTKDTAEPIYSCSKSIASTLVGMAIEDGKIKGLDQSAADFVPPWKGTPKAAITLRHMLTMTSGIKNTPGLNPRKEVDAFEETAALPLEHPPGEVWAYNTPVYRMLLRVLEHATGQPVEQYTRSKLAAPLGLESSRWDGSPAPHDQTNYTWYRSSVRDMSRFGLLALRGGVWDKQRLISARFLQDATSPSQGLNRSYGYLWWLNGQASHLRPGGGSVEPGMLWPACPRDAFAALGAFDKKIYIVPSLDLVVARHGQAAGLNTFDNELLGGVCRAVRK